MSISHKELIARISQRSGFSEDEVESQLQEMIKNAISTEKGKPYKVDEFGTFRLKKGRLSFEPDDILTLEINYRYAGMTPIVVERASAVVEEDDNDEIIIKKKVTEELAMADKKTADEPSEKSKEPTTQAGNSTKEEEKVKPTAETKPIEKPERPSIPVTDKITIEPANVEKVPEKPPASTPKKEPITASPKPAVVKQTGFKPTPEIPIMKKPGTKPFVPPEFKKPNPKRTVFIAVAATVAALLVIIYLLRLQVDTPVSDIEKPTITQTEQQPASQPSSEPETTPALPPQESETNRDESTNPSTNSDAVVQDIISDLATKAVEKPVEADPGYGLMEKYEPRLTRFYTIVIYSLSNESNANLETESLIKKGFRSFVNSYSTQTGTTLHRVCLGQFASFQDAKNSIVNLPQAFQKNHFIKRLTLKPNN